MKSKCGKQHTRQGLTLRLTAALLLSVAIGTNALGQQNSIITNEVENTFSMFREPSYISALGGLGNIEPLIFEADIVPYYMLSINKNSRWGIELSPRIIIRMYNEESYPIRTPSFMPRATLFYKFIAENSTHQDLYGYLSWCHHSNGQDGYFYNTDSLTINTKTGNFSTNMVEGGIFLSHPDKKIPHTVNYVKLSALYHYKTDTALRGMYGKLRIFSDFQSSINLSRMLRVFGYSAQNSASHNTILSQSLRVGWIVGSLSNAQTLDTKRMIFRYTVSLKPSFLNDVTVFAQYYYGQDYYNIYFYRQLHVFRVGISAKTSIFE